MEAQVPFDDDLDGALELGEEALIEEPRDDVPAEAPKSALKAAEDALEENIVEEAAEENLDIPTGLKNELKTVLSYMDQLLESLP